jgi:hypothetical protein
MIKQFKDYDKTQAYGDFATLPKGGYVVKIMGASKETNSNGEYLKIGCDIAEGEYKDFFAESYKNDKREDKKWGCNFLLNLPKDDGTEKDGWTKRSFKTFTEALEDSNSNYHFDWDESKFKGLIIGGLFNEQDYEKSDGSIGTSVRMARVCTAQKIREGNYKLPEDKKIAVSTANNGNTSASGDFMSIPNNIDEELPF